MHYPRTAIAIISILISQNAISHPVFNEAIYITSNETGRFVCSESGKLFATGHNADKHCLFQLVKFGNVVKLWSIHHRQFVSGYGKGWPLIAAVDDESWSKFKIIYASNTFTLQSQQPISKFAYVSVIGASRVLRIAEVSPTEWSYFISYKASDMTPDLASYINERKFKGD